MLDLIPNTIIQVFLKVDRELKDIVLMKSNQIQWKKYSEKYGFKYILITDDNYQEYIEGYDEFYENLRYTWNKIDFIRYLAINKIGGIYFDLDMEPLRDIFCLLRDRYIIGSWKNSRGKYEKSNSIIGSRKGGLTPLIEYSIQEYREKSCMKIYESWERRFMLQTTGVRMFKRWCKMEKIHHTQKISDYVKDYEAKSWITNFG